MVASASTIMIATSSPAIRPATTMSKTADSSCSWVGNATHWSSIRATRVAPTGPENGRPDSWVEADAALIATTSYMSLGSSAITVMTTWTSLRRPLAKVGRSGRSIRRQVRIASSLGPALAAEERAGDPARGVHPLLDVDREREEVEVLLGVLAGRGGRQQHGLVVEVGGDGAGGLTGQAAGLEPDGAGAERAVVDHGVGGVDVLTPPWVTLLSFREQGERVATPVFDGSLRRAMVRRRAGHYRGPEPVASRSVLVCGAGAIGAGRASRSTRGSG